MALSFGSYSVANALSWPVYGVSFNCGYFAGPSSKSCANSAPANATSNVIYAGIPTTGLGVVNTDIPASKKAAADLVVYLKGLNAGSSAQDRAGSAFIVNTMLGHNAPGGGKTVSSTDWTDLSSRLDYLASNGAIQWGAQRETCDSSIYSSYYSGAVGDDIIYVKDAANDPTQCSGKSMIHPLIDFYQPGTNNRIYTLDRSCANPMGSMLPLSIPVPLKDWNITVGISIDKSSALPGATVTWTHTVTNSVSNTTKPVDYGYKGTGFSGSGNNYVSVGLLPIGTIPSSSPVKTYPSTYQIPASATKGTQYCRATSANPSSKASGEVVSGYECVTVSSLPPVNDPCRPIQITVTPNIYSGNTITKTGLNVGESSYVHTYTYPTYTPPVEVISVNQTTGSRTVLQANGVTSWSVPKLLNTTSFHTTGDPYNITFHETTNHVVGVSEYMKTISVYHWVTHYRTRCSGSGKSRSCWSVPYQSYDFWYSYRAYNYSEINYSDGQTTRFTYTGGSMPININGNGTNKSWMMPANSNGVNGVGPCYDYSLSPSINAMGSKREPGETINVNPTVASSSYTQANFTSFWNMYKTQTHSKNTNWQITMMRVAPNVSMPSYKTGAVTTTNPCNYFDPSNVSTCTNISSGSTVFSTSGNPSSSVNYSYTVPDVAAGTKACFAFSIKPNQSDPLYYTPNWNNSEPWSHTSFDPANNCIIVVKKPKVQIWGGDLATGGFAQTSTTIKSGNIFGSWVEYAIFARGSITGTASGSAFYSPSGAGVSSSIDYNKLSFSNVCNNSAAGCYGNYVAARTIPNVAASFVGGTTLTGSSVVASSLSSGIYTATSDVSLEASTLPAGKSVIIKALNGTVYINGDQIYANGPYKNTSELPQLVIIANRIVVRADVANVDAWLVGTSSVETCDDIGKTINLCDTKLTVNGPVMTNKLQLYRTAGSGVGNQSGDPAEVFNLRADAYLWAANRSIGNGSAQTVMTTDVPPRN